MLNKQHKLQNSFNNRILDMTDNAIEMYRNYDCLKTHIT